MATNILLPTAVHLAFWEVFCLHVHHLLSKFTLKSAGVKISATAKSIIAQFRQGWVNPIY